MLLPTYLIFNLILNSGHITLFSSGFKPDTIDFLCILPFKRLGAIHLINNFGALGLGDFSFKLFEVHLWRTPCQGPMHP